MFDINHPNINSKVVVAMSGGVDSSTVAAMLAHKGHNVVGITLQLYDHGVVVANSKTCCAGQDIYDAKEVAYKIGIPHYVLDYETNFKQSVIDNFVESYAKGETPLPCVKCNQSVKFKDLLQMAKDLGAEALVTGHYVRKIHGKEGPELHTAIDQSRDQSYFLFATTKEQLNYLEFPLGNYTKVEIRDIALKFGLSVFDKKDSQDICFVPNGDYRKVVTSIRPDLKKSGKIIHIDGFEMGIHDGIINYTIGQRRKTGVSFHEPLYVIRIDDVKNIVYLGPESALLSNSFNIQEMNWISNISNQDDITVKVRSKRPRTNAIINRIDDTNAAVTLMSFEKAITPGQACVIYENEKMIGGGWITK